MTSDPLIDLAEELFLYQLLNTLTTLKQEIDCKRKLFSQITQSKGFFFNK